jgi:hypothetical protein
MIFVAKHKGFQIQKTKQRERRYRIRYSSFAVSRSTFRIVRNFLDKQPSQKAAFVALWHYDKLVLKSLTKKESSVTMFVPVQDAKKCGIYQPTPGKLYSEADICPMILEARKGEKGGKQLLALVPTYFKIEDGLNDAEEAKKSKDRMIALQKVAQFRGMRKIPPKETPGKRQKANAVVPRLMTNDAFFKLTDEEKTKVLNEHRENIDAYVNAKNAELELLTTVI